MKLHRVSRFAAAALICLMPVIAEAADASVADMSPEELAAIADRMRETSERMRADLERARARFEARKAQARHDAKREEEVRQDNEARQAKQTVKVAAISSNKASKQATPQESPAKSLARREAEREQAEIRALEERTARAFAELQAIEARQAKAAKALAAARKDVGISAFADE